MLVNEVLCRNLRDRRAVARYAGMTGSPDESGAKRRERGLAKAGNSRVRRGMLQLAWRWLMFQKDSALSQWYKARTEHAPERTRKTMIDLPPEKWTPGYAYFASACCGVM
jgi:transposase